MPVPHLRCCSPSVLLWRGWYGGAAATQSSVDGWPLWACLTGNRCVSSEDEGPANKHYWRTSAACHNMGRAGARRHPSASLESECLGWGGGKSPLVLSSLTHHSTQDVLDIGCMYGPGTCPPVPDHSRRWPTGEKTLQWTWKMPQGECTCSLMLTHTHTLTLSSGNPPFTIRKAGMALILDPAQADDERCLVVALLKFAHWHTQTH